MAGLNTLTYLTAYLDECGRNGGKPLTGKALERFLPWNASPEDLRTWAQPPPDRQNPGSVTPLTGVAASGRHAGRRHALSQDFRILTLTRLMLTWARHLSRSRSFATNSYL